MSADGEVEPYRKSTRAAEIILFMPSHMGHKTREYRKRFRESKINKHQRGNFHLGASTLGVTKPHYILETTFSVMEDVS